MNLSQKHNKYHFILICLIALFYSLSVSADQFEILSTKGLVELSKDQKDWKVVSPPQKIVSGTWIRTGPSASVALVLPNKTQTRIAKNSELFLP